MQECTKNIVNVENFINYEKTNKLQCLRNINSFNINYNKRFKLMGSLLIAIVIVLIIGYLGLRG